VPFFYSNAQRVSVGRLCNLIKAVLFGRVATYGACPHAGLLCFGSFTTDSGERIMLSDKNAMAMIGVRDVKEAEEFYGGTLGLTKLWTEGEHRTTYRSGNSALIIFQSQYAGTNKATAVVWTVGDELDAVVAKLKSKGVVFERYDMPGLTLEGDVYVSGNMKVAWFKDPDGNILSIVSV
jgi:catechol 2,3-dioxygenase-like lactoylglutathione lyase family enzyme